MHEEHEMRLVPCASNYLSIISTDPSIMFCNIREICDMKEEVEKRKGSRGHRKKNAHGILQPRLKQSSGFDSNEATRWQRHRQHYILLYVGTFCGIK